jgi:hypothetical protein
MLLPVYQIKWRYMTEDYNKCERWCIKSRIIQYKLYLVSCVYNTKTVLYLIFESVFQDKKDHPNNTVWKIYIYKPAIFFTTRNVTFFISEYNFSTVTLWLNQTDRKRSVYLIKVSVYKAETEIWVGNIGGAVHHKCVKLLKVQSFMNKWKSTAKTAMHQCMSWSPSSKTDRKSKNHTVKINCPLLPLL